MVPDLAHCSSSIGLITPHGFQHILPLQHLKEWRKHKTLVEEGLNVHFSFSFTVNKTAEWGMKSSMLAWEVVRPKPNGSAMGRTSSELKHLVLPLPRHYKKYGASVPIFLTM